MTATAAPPRPSAPAAQRPRRRRSWSGGVIGALGVLGAITTAELLSRLAIVNPDYLPPATEIFADLWRLLGEADTWVALRQTVTGWAIGLAIAMAIGVVAGVVIGSVPFLRAFTASTIEFLRPIPSVALIPLVVLLFGTRPLSAITLVVYAATWQVLVQVLYGVADIDPVARDTARSYQFSAWRIARTVIWPSALPYVVTGFRLAAAVALILEITAELVIGVPGLGRSIGIAQSSGAVTETYALVILVGLLGLAVNVAARAVEKRVLHWHPSVRRSLG
ncbi:ABC transporter permease subunit [Actinotalea sp. M2MS4P-6]|uniref:ABC transporter permease n=1 Tax=Actinotalea sp. M2MS4P-6 TaxID=2983762 RepID=UPI0021E46B5C|nr:ABC transporter permease subunit [Actinotalea sp. M2MS4P-6]MCV2394331.1 ABC transporter permease subunit [Actinotalea sp. M2MS4P-6]